MLFKNRKFYILNFALILGLLGGMFGLMPTRASADTYGQEFSSGSSNTTPRINISTPRGPIGIDSKESKLVNYSLTESANISGRITSRTFQFFTQYDVPLSEPMGPYPASIDVDPLNTSDWNELVYLPENVADKVRSRKDFAVVLKTAFTGVSSSGAEFSAQASLLLLMPPARFSKASPDNWTVVPTTNQSLRWNASTGAVDYEYCFDTINNDLCDTNWTGSYWLGTYNTNAALQDLPQNTTFYWQVRANNMAGTTYANNGKWWRFTTASANTPTPTRTNTPTHTPTYTPTVTSPSPSNPLYLSLTGNQSVGGVASADEDILRFNGTSWSLLFDGSDVGVGGSDLSGFSIVDSDTILMSFNTTFILNGMSITPRDVVQFDAISLGTSTAGTFSMYLNGIDVGLDVSAENIDSVSLMADDRILISTTGNPVVTGVTGARDEDVLAFTPTSLGNNTGGTWATYFDGSDVGLAETSAEDVDALDVTSDGKIYLSTAGDFAVTGASGADEDVFICTASSVGSVTACNYSPALYLDGSTWGLAANDVDAFNLLATGTVPTITPTATQSPGGPTSTPTRTPTQTPSPTFTLTPTKTATPTITQTPGASDLIFADGFESGNLSAWTSNTTDSGDLLVSPSAALIGSRGLQAVIDDNNTIYVTDDSPNAESRYRARFYFDPNSIAMAHGDTHFIFKGFMGTSNEVLRVEFRQFSGTYQFRAGLLDDANTWISTLWYAFTDASHFIELDWRAATGAGANNGGIAIWIDGALLADLNTLDNDTRRMDRARLGVLAGIDSGTRGTYYFDAFESRRQNYIGPAVTTPTPTATPTSGSGSARVEVYAGGNFLSVSDIPPQTSVRPIYGGINNGPIWVTSTNEVPIIASQRFAYNNGSAWTSHSELIGLPYNQASTTYHFPWYDNVDFNSHLRIGNVGGSSTVVTVTVAGVIQGTYNLAPSQSQQISYSGLDNGPVRVQSSGTQIIASLGVGDFNGSVWTSHSELMGLPQGQLSTSYMFPWYNNVEINSQFRIGNVGNSAATVTVTVGGVVQGTYTLAPNQSQQVSYAGLSNGPVKIESLNGVPIVASMRFAYFNGSAWTNHSEIMGLPTSALSTKYFLPIYDSVNHNSQLSLGNVGNSTTTVTVTINGTQRSMHSISPNQTLRISYPALNSGPVMVESSGGVPIIVSERVRYNNGTAITNFSELIGLPFNQLSTVYFFPWYNDVNLDTQLRIGVP